MEGWDGLEGGGMGWVGMIGGEVESMGGGGDLRK